MEEARQILQGMIQDDPSSFSAHINLAFTARFDGNVEGAVAHYERAVAAYDVPLAWMGKGTALWRLGRTAESKRILAELEARAKREYVSPYLLGIYYYVMGEVERAFDFFEEGAEIKDFLTLFLRQTSTFLGYQDHPRYLALAHRIWPDDFPA
jgi:tetratricopeptide (TPR) repeat protein